MKIIQISAVWDHDMYGKIIHGLDEEGKLYIWAPEAKIVEGKAYKRYGWQLMKDELN